MRTVGIVLVFFFFACCGGLLSKKYISVLNGVKNAQELLCSIKEGVAGERLTMAEILRGYIFEHKGSERFINMLLSGGENERILYDIKAAEESGFCLDGYSNKILEEAFLSFGKTAAEEQTDRFSHLYGMLEKRYDAVLPEEMQKAKLAKSLGIAAGMLAAAVLL